MRGPGNDKDTIEGAPPDAAAASPPPAPPSAPEPKALRRPCRVLTTPDARKGGAESADSQHTSTQPQPTVT